MSSIAISGNASGTAVFTIASPATSTNRTLTLPDATGTVLTTATAGVPVNGPAFSAYASTNQAAPSISVWTKVLFAAESFDTNSNFSASRFTPTISGYYQLTYSVYLNTASTSLLSSAIYKNGSRETLGFVTTGANPVYSSGGTALIYFNGTTDYAEVYVYISNTSDLFGVAGYTYFQAFLARSAL